jgi:hypothetical protein
VLLFCCVCFDADTMTSALVASWTAYLKDLQQWIHDPPQGFPHQREREAKLFPESLPHAAHKRLVHDVQVLTNRLNI